MQRLWTLVPGQRLILCCPASDFLRSSLFGNSLSLYDIWFRPWGVGRLLGLHGFLPCPIPQKGSGSINNISLTLGNGQNFFAKLLFQSNNLYGSGSGRIFALPLPRKKDRFHISGLNTEMGKKGFLCLFEDRIEQNSELYKMFSPPTKICF